MESAYIDQIQEQRVEKDWFFKNHAESPLPLDKRMSFKGLKYYPIDPSLRFHVPLQEHTEKTTIHVEDSKGGTQSYLRWGQFTVEIEGQKVTLQAYKSHPSEPNIWVPFRDTTNGKETYGAGRYIDLNIQRDIDDGRWILDFNTAYNPFCAYSENYICPFIPPENWLKVPIKAGEKAYSDSE